MSLVTRHSSLVTRPVGLLGLSVTLVMMTPAAATTSAWSTNAQRFAAATHVVEGDVEAIRHSFVVDQGDEWPVTLYDVRVERVYRGAAMERFTLAVLGGPGRDPRYEMAVAGAPILEVGDHAILSVAPYLDVGYLPTGLGAGVVRRVTEGGVEVAGSSERRYETLGSWTCDRPLGVADPEAGVVDEARPLHPPMRWDDVTSAVTECAAAVDAAERSGGAR